MGEMVVAGAKNGVWKALGAVALALYLEGRLMPNRRREPSGRGRRAVRAHACLGAVSGSLGAILLLVLLGLVAIAVQGGCATKLHRRAAKPYFLPEGQVSAAQGSAWDGVLPGPASAGLDSGYEVARRDEGLNRRDAISPAYQDAFADERLPSLDWRSYLYLSRSQNRFLYFGRPPRQPRWIEP
jgi:hypothetical protein